MKTIFALATAQGCAGVAIVRLSGPDAARAAGRLMTDVPAMRGVRRLTDTNGDLLDEALVLRFAEGRSFTGEEVVELHLHGGPAIVSAVLHELGKQPELSPAEPGAFTRRALENGRLDLAQVEGLADLIDAETDRQRQQAIRVFSGALGDLVDGWRADLVRAVALLEATIDFADEDVPVDVNPEVIELMDGVMAAMARESAGVVAAERIRDGFEVAIVGAPNVGKSTLLNRLAGRDVAITSEVAGTTRDVIEVRMDIAGFPVTMLDTAGIRETDDIVEGLGVDRARHRASEADIRVHMLLSSDDDTPDIGKFDIIVWAKADLGSETGSAVSGLTGKGVDWLLSEIATRLQDRVASVGVAMRARHRHAMTRAVEEIEMARRLLDDGEGTEFAAEHLWSAVRAVDSLVGRVDVEDILGEIFASFCIGK
ncbi:tRNA uridine-5-carboxymethylaminomethyl(34) synthesis GTPase MnmE [Yoonia sp. 2307UL14-13]|uniref:tRNA uridine-5-carboxymethylaminomethyl(34) synthesis GTPase MnmE n=1 Tax=Yoonia sp. 2307UL14-13 TaxID=3126506 RepID=UPI0030B7DAD9